MAEPNLSRLVYSPALNINVEVMKFNKSERREIASSMLEMVGLTRFSEHYPNQLSGGMQQRVNIARALAVRPDLDQPAEANEDAIDALKELTVKGNIMVDNASTIYVQYIPEIDYRKDAGYNATEFSVYLRDYITRRANASTSSLTSKEYNRFLLEVYFSVHPELRTDFEENYYNWFHDTAGFFVKGLSGKIRIQILPPRLILRVMAIRAASIWLEVIQPHSWATRP